MIEGEFRGEAPYITLTLTGEQDVADVAFVVDTGYTGYLAVPETILRAIGAATQGTRYIGLADGSFRRGTIYTVTVEWEDEEREIEVIALNDEPLLGVAMMRSLRLLVEVTNGGDVLLEPL